MTAFPKADVQNIRIGTELMSAYGRKQTYKDEIGLEAGE
jgi:hypothetical protein